MGRDPLSRHVSSVLQKIISANIFEDTHPFMGHFGWLARTSPNRELGASGIEHVANRGYIIGCQGGNFVPN